MLPGQKPPPFDHNGVAPPAATEELAIAFYSTKSHYNEFSLNGNLPDLQMGISLNREAVRLLPTLHPDRDINILAIALGTRFDQTGDIKDVNEAISLHQEALELRPTPN